MGSSAIRIDTLSIAKELEESGIPIKQAEAQTRVYAKVINMVIEDQLATKQDLQKTELNLKQDIQAVAQNLVKVEQGLKQDIQTVEQNLLKEVHSIRQDMHGLEQNLLREMNGLDRRVIKLEDKIEAQTLALMVRFGGLLVAAVIVLAALIKL
jgi:hypothetical protein